MKRAVLVVKGQEPRVVTFERDSYEVYTNIIKDVLSEQEKVTAEADSVESFGSGIPGVLGYVEANSAFHPYERNRHWYGPALFVEYNYEGDCVSMSDENLEAVMEMFSLKNEVSSPSSYINNFLDTYAKSEMHNVSIENNCAILDTMDAVDFLKNVQSDDDIMFIETMLRDIETASKQGAGSIEELVSKFLKDFNSFLFAKRIEERSSSMYTF